MPPLPFAKLETFSDIGQVLAMAEETDAGLPCVSIRVATPTGDAIARVDYTFAHTPEAAGAAAAFFDTLTREDIYRMGLALHQQASALTTDTL